MRVNYYNIDLEFKRSYKDFLNRSKKFKKSGNFLIGDFLSEFEIKLAKILNTKYVIGVANGTDALEIAIRVLNPPQGAEIITTSNTFVSTVNAIINMGCKPVFVDIDETYNIDPQKIEKAITSKTFAIMPVHLNGLPACLNKIKKISKKYKIHLIEDAAQSILSMYDNKYIGNQNNMACFSMHPTKNLGVIGDGGFIATNNVFYFKKIKLLRNHGLNNNGKTLEVGRNSRLSEINASIASLRLNFLKKDTKIKRNIANYYSKNLCEAVNTPKNSCCRNTQHTYHRYVIRVKKRKKLIDFLKKNKIEVKIHYPKNIHEYSIFSKYIKKNTDLKKTIEYSKNILSLPCNHFMSIKQAKYVVEKINQFYGF